MRRLIACGAVAALMLVLGMTGNAQFWDKMTNPKVSIPLTHPPDLGLQINKIAFGPVTGEGANEFVDALTERFVRSGIEVVERSRLEALLKEQNFSLTGYVDQQSAAQMGKILGPAVMLFVNMQRHTFEKKRLYENSKDYKGIVRTYTMNQDGDAVGPVYPVAAKNGRWELIK